MISDALTTAYAAGLTQVLAAAGMCRFAAIAVGSTFLVTVLLHSPQASSEAA